MKMKNDLLIIDPQNDFCHPQGNLFVPGADADGGRIADFIKRNQKRLNRVHVTVDSHHEVDVAHPCFWVNSKGENPAPFTIISHGDVLNGVWRPAIMGLMDWCKKYTKALEDGGRYPLIIWPPHCRIAHTEKRQVMVNGSPIKNPATGENLTYDFCGYAVYEPVSNALSEWAKANLKTVNFVTKGSNPLTEHYSAVKAEVPDPNDVTTQINSRFIKSLEEADNTYVCGEALSHCLKNTVGDIADAFGDDNIKKLVLLIDCSASVPGFEKNGTDFVDAMVKRGMRVMKSTDVRL